MTEVTEQLTEKHCIPCEGGVKPLTTAEAAKYLSRLDNWQINDRDTIINKEYKFKDFYHTMSFVNAIAHMANQEGHHPDLEVGYNYCTVNYTTHAIGGLSENDFICAHKAEKLLAK